jgi:hypothetical protein
MMFPAASPHHLTPFVLARLPVLVTLLLVLLAGLMTPSYTASAQGDAFVNTWQTTMANESITIPTGGGPNITDYDF